MDSPSCRLGHELTVTELYGLNQCIELETNLAQRMEPLDSGLPVHGLAGLLHHWTPSSAYYKYPAVSAKMILLKRVEASLLAFQCLFS